MSQSAAVAQPLLDVDPAMLRPYGRVVYATPGKILELVAALILTLQPSPKLVELPAIPAPAGLVLTGLAWPQMQLELHVPQVKPAEHKAE